MGKNKSSGVLEELHVRNSERGTMDRCPQQWYWGWREGLKPKETAKPLWFGTGIHLALAHYYAPGFKRRKDFIDVWRAFAHEEADYMRINFGVVDEDAYVEARALGESMLTEYVKEYDGDKHWDVIATEQTFEVRLPFAEPQKGDEPLRRKYLEWLHSTYGDFFILNGTMDGVYRDKRDKRVKLMEHKTAGAISVGHLPMDNQAGTYWMVAHTVGKAQGWLTAKQGIAGITYNFLKKTMPDLRPRDPQGYVTNKPGKDAYINALDGMVEWEQTRIGTPKYPVVSVLEQMAEERGLVVLGERSKVQPTPMFQRVDVRRSAAERRTQVHRLQGEVEKMIMYRSGLLPLVKSPDRNSCSWCGFKDMCELHERGSDWEEYKRAMFRVQDPYADHRKSA